MLPTSNSGEKVVAKPEKEAINGGSASGEKRWRMAVAGRKHQRVAAAAAGDSALIDGGVCGGNTSLISQRMIMAKVGKNK